MSSNRSRRGAGGGGDDVGVGAERDVESAMSDSLLQFLSDDNIVKVGVGIHHDIDEIERVYGSGCCGSRSSYVDIGKLAHVRYPKLKRLGLRNIRASILGCKLSKAHGKWSA